jgi:chemotaxis methyl-accepting protein methylase
MKSKSQPTRRSRNRTPSLDHAPPVSPARESFPIVGIGASAGGLEALEQFLARVPAGAGMAFVIVQHLDPTHKGIMPELLQRATGLKVIQVRDRTRVRADCVYVIPPNKDMSILHGVLHLFAPAAPRGQRLPIDFFLRSLAEDQQERSIGVILSGMGSDGTLGLRAIKEKAGVALVQEPATAKFDSMPRSAMDAGLADIVAPAGELPGRIVAYLGRVPLLAQTEVALEDKTRSALEKAVILLRAHTGGHDFSMYKRNTLYRRIERRMGIHQIDKMGVYVRFLQENPQELDLLFKELLIGVTNFFRDPAAWDQLRDEAIAPLLTSRSPGPALRAWVPGCSTGEEAYSLAIVFKEAIKQIKPSGNLALQIFATDLDRDAIDKARIGIFPGNITADVSPARLSRFFARDERGFRVRKEIREMVIFAPQNLIMDPPFTKLDILSCRNLLIYLTPEVQRKLMPLFHYSLIPGGLLFLGSAETIGGATELFAPLSGKCRIYRRTDYVLRPQPVDLPASFGPGVAGGPEERPTASPPLSFQTQADQLVLQRYSPPAVLVNKQGDIFYVSGHTGEFLEPAAGKANWNLFAMARDGLRYELANAFQRALGQKEEVTLHGLKVRTNNGKQHVDVSIRRLEEPGPLQGLVMVVFTEVAAPLAPQAAGGRTSKSHARTPRLKELEQELLQVRSEAQAAHEVMQTAQEELRSANEELQSTNEELQSTNEELTTSKEEMQSMNEELQTLNTELQSKVDELSRASSDMKNLLDSTDIATLFLDKDLNVRRFTPQATQIIKLIASDVGRPVTDLVSDLNYPRLEDAVREVLRTLTTVEKAVAARDGHWFTVRIMPYRTMDDRIDGVVITFMDITASKLLEAKLRAKQAGLKRRVATQSATGRRRKG